METVVPSAQRRLLEDETDAVVAAEAVHRDAEAMRILFDRYKRPVFNIARRILGDEGEAEDVRQQVYFEALAGIEQFDPAKGPFKNWLFQRALHRALNRKQHLEAERMYRSDRIEDHSPIAIDDTRTRLRLSPPELSRLADELLANLKSRERQVVTLTFCDCFTRQEIAAHLGITISAVRHSLKKGLQLMHSVLTTASGGRNGTGKDRNG